jgi:hypothetical protein
MSFLPRQKARGLKNFSKRCYNKKVIADHLFIFFADRMSMDDEENEPRAFRLQISLSF